MPRTKRVASRKRSSSIENVKPNKKELDRGTLQSYFKSIDKEADLCFKRIDDKLYSLHLGFANKIGELCINFKKDDDKTITELMTTKHVTNETARNITVNTTKTIYNGRSKRRSSSTEPRSNSTTQNPKSRRISRSLSRQTRNNLVTPALKHPPQVFGTVTPKVKPNAPQVILRRPNQGEIAISMQGSPLMVSSITTDRLPNINIPLNDGRMIAIQPERGLRFSQLPDFDSATRRNLELLRDNLNKVCSRGPIV